MCGVFGYVGRPKKNLSDFLIEGLLKLEYRGYDSAGIAVFDNGTPKIFKKTGEIKNLSKSLNGKKFSGYLGIGHTRWATHGGVTEKNSHPHTDCSGKIVVVHNGIIENFEEIKSDLLKKGHKIVSETDTEVFAHLVEEKLKEKKDLVQASLAAFNSLEGLNAVVVCSPSGELIAFRKGSPLVAGVGKEGNFVSSDIPALLSETRNIVFLDEGEGVFLDKDSVLLINTKTGKFTKPKIENITMEEEIADKGNFKHFLIKEIFEEPEVMMRVANIEKGEIEKAVSYIKDAWGTYFSACGTASHAGMTATYLFSEIAKRHVNFTFGSEFPYFEDFLKEKSLLIVASQSGETMDTLEAVRAAKRHNSKVMAMVNVPGSSLTRISDFTILLKAGPERSVLSTKAYIAKLTLFLILAYALIGKYKEGALLVEETAKKISTMFRNGLEDKLKRLAEKLYKKEHIYLIGRGVNYPTALEGALKIKESSYIHAEGFAGGELKHGVIALVDKGTPCIAIAANDRAYDSIISNTMEMSARGAYVIGISPKKEKVFDYWIEVPDAGFASPIVNIVPLQMLAYYLTVSKGLNPDKPRNLAKSVTVK